MSALCFIWLLEIVGIPLIISHVKVFCVLLFFEYFLSLKTNYILQKKKIKWIKTQMKVVVVDNNLDFVNIMVVHKLWLHMGH